MRITRGAREGSRGDQRCSHTDKRKRGGKTHPQRLHLAVGALKVPHAYFFVRPRERLRLEERQRFSEGAECRPTHGSSRGDGKPRCLSRRKKKKIDLTFEMTAP